MKADQTVLQRLDAPTKAPYWPVGVDGLYYFLNIASTIYIMFTNSFF